MSIIFVESACFNFGEFGGTKFFPNLCEMSLKVTTVYCSKIFLQIFQVTSKFLKNTFCKMEY